MKTILTFAISVLLLNSTIISAGNTLTLASDNETVAAAPVMVTYSLPSVEEESYVNDIPFDTKAVALNSLFLNLEGPEAEAYVNDIPMEIEEIATMYNFNLSNIHPEDESYIDDIPFNTADVVKHFVKCGE